jgi:hypothetical protein
MGHRPLLSLETLNIRCGLPQAARDQTLLRTSARHSRCESHGKVLKRVLIGPTKKSDIQTIAWGEIVRRIGQIRQDNAVTSVGNGEGSTADVHDAPKLDAHDVAK